MFKKCCGKSDFVVFVIEVIVVALIFRSPYDTCAIVNIYLFTDSSQGGGKTPHSKVPPDGEYLH